MRASNSDLTLTALSLVSRAHVQAVGLPDGLRPLADPSLDEAERRRLISSFLTHNGVPPEFARAAARTERDYTKALRMVRMRWLGVCWLGVRWLGVRWLGVRWLGVRWLGVSAINGCLEAVWAWVLWLVGWLVGCVCVRPSNNARPDHDGGRDSTWLTCQPRSGDRRRRVPSAPGRRCRTRTPCACCGPPTVRRRSLWQRFTSLPMPAMPFPRDRSTLMSPPPTWPTSAPPLSTPSHVCR